MRCPTPFFGTLNRPVFGGFLAATVTQQRLQSERRINCADISLFGV